MAAEFDAFMRDAQGKSGYLNLSFEGKEKAYQ
jgi:hypothetical protein